MKWSTFNKDFDVGNQIDIDVGSQIDIDVGSQTDIDVGDQIDIDVIFLKKYILHPNKH